MERSTALDLEIAEGADSGLPEDASITHGGYAYGDLKQDPRQRSPSDHAGTHPLLPVSRRRLLAFCRRPSSAPPTSAGRQPGRGAPGATASSTRPTGDPDSAGPAR